MIRKEQPVRLVILGEGEERSKLESLVHKFKLEDDTSMPGFVENPYAYVARSSLFVLFSAWEGLSNVLIEAMECGCLIVATDCPACVFRSNPARVSDQVGHPVGVTRPPHYRSDASLNFFR